MRRLNRAYDEHTLGNTINFDGDLFSKAGSGGGFFRRGFYASRLYSIPAVAFLIGSKPIRKAKDGGAEGDRTPDPRLAKPVLYQLSYNPTKKLSVWISNSPRLF